MKPSLLNTSKAMAFATAIGAASVAWAQQVTGVFPASTDFESDTDYVVLDSTASNVSPRPESHGTFTASPSKVLDLEEADDPIVKSFGTSLSGSVYFDALLKLAPATTTPEVSGATDKLLVYTKIFTEPTTTTNLCVWAKDAANGTAQEFQLTNTIDKATWYRVVIAVNNGQYQIFLNDNYPSTPCATAGGANTFYALSDGALSEVALAGSGRVDDLVLSDVAPDKKLMTLSWDTSLTASYTVAGGEPIALSGTSPQTNAVAPGAEVVLTVSNSDGVSKTYTGTAGTDSAIGSASAAFTWAEYLGAAVDGAYQIDNLAELKLFQKGVAAGLVTSNETFKLTADVTLDAPWPGIGVQNGKDIYSTAAFDEAAFCGTFDGQNHTISGFQMVGVAGNPANNGEGLDYCGFFNSTYSATIQNLKIAYAGGLFAADTTASTKESGATFVGVAKNSTLRNLTSVAGTVASSKGFGGIVGYLTSGTTVDSCTNNVNMTSLANNKCGGIAMIAQGGSAVTIRNCQNNGTQTTGSSNSEYGAIVGYVGVDITIADCETTVGRFLKHQGSTVTLQGVNKGDATVLAYHGAATPGLNFATVDGSVATFVADNALALNGEYKVMSAGATATFAFAEAGTIAFDTALATPTYAITAAEGLTLTDETVGTVKTYTATAAATIPTWATDVDGQSVIDQAVSDKYADWADKVADGDTTVDRSAQFLMNVPVAAEVALTIDGIEVTSDGTIVTIGATKTISGTTEAIALGATDAGVDTSSINGILNVMVADTLGNWAKKSIPLNNLSYVGGKAQILIPAGDGRFVKASVDYSKPSSSITAVTE